MLQSQNSILGILGIPSPPVHDRAHVTALADDGAGHFCPRAKNEAVRLTPDDEALLRNMKHSPRAANMKRSLRE